MCFSFTSVFELTSVWCFTVVLLSLAASSHSLVFRSGLVVGFGLYCLSFSSDHSGRLRPFVPLSLMLPPPSQPAPDASHTIAVQRDLAQKRIQLTSTYDRILPSSTLHKFGKSRQLVQITCQITQKFRDELPLKISTHSDVFENFDIFVKSDEVSSIFQ